VTRNLRVVSRVERPCDFFKLMYYAGEATFAAFSEKS
jgi:hypothetical protein